MRSDRNRLSLTGPGRRRARARDASSTSNHCSRGDGPRYPFPALIVNSAKGADVGCGERSEPHQTRRAEAMGFAPHRILRRCRVGHGRRYDQGPRSLPDGSWFEVSRITESGAPQTRVRLRAIRSSIRAARSMRAGGASASASRLIACSPTARRRSGASTISCCFGTTRPTGRKRSPSPRSPGASRGEEGLRSAASTEPSCFPMPTGVQCAYCAACALPAAE